LNFLNQGTTNIEPQMHGKEKANSKQKLLFNISFIQNDKEKSTLFISQPDRNKRPLVLAILPMLF